MNEILHTLQKIFSYAYINSYQSLKKSVLHFHLKCDFPLTIACIRGHAVFAKCLAGGLACGDQHRRTVLQGELASRVTH